MAASSTFPTARRASWRACARCAAARDYDATFGTRMRGEGIWAQLLAQRFKKATARHALDRARVELDLTRFRRPATPSAAAPAPAQASLF